MDIAFYTNTCETDEINVSFNLYYLLNTWKTDGCDRDFIANGWISVRDELGIY